jgi:hypothetical protein
VILCLSNWIPYFSWPVAGTRLLQEAKYFCDALQVSEELGEVAGAAMRCQVLQTCGCVCWAVHKYILDGLDGLAAQASDLVLYVLREGPLGVLPHKGVTCDEAVKSRAGASPPKGGL